jgi:hypothetical protein
MRRDGEELEVRAAAERGDGGAGGHDGERGERGERGAAGRRFRPPSRRTFVAMLGAAAASVVLRDRLSGQRVIRNPATGKPIWIGHV